MTMPTVVVDCASQGQGWTCTVTVSDAGTDISTHRVRVSERDLRRLDPTATEPSSLIERSFAFLLERESARSILPTFDVMEIGRYFPEYETEIRPGR